MDAGIDHVFRPVAFLESFEGVPEIGILFVPALGLHHFRASRHEVFDALHSVLSELLGQSSTKCRHALCHVLRADMGVVRVSAGSAFGVSCARNACFIDRCTAAEDLSFWTRRMAYCMSREYLLRAPSRKHDVDFTLHFPSESREPLRGAGVSDPKHVRLSAHELNTGTGAFAPPPRPFVPAWITRTAAYRPPFRVTHSVNLPTAGAPPMV